MTELEYLERAEEARGKLYRAALLTLGSETAAVDAVDEAVYKGYLGYRKLREPKYLETWLVRILLNVCRDELRRRKRELAVEELPETAGEEFDALPLKEAIRRLPAQLRDVIILRYFTGLTLEETAAALELPRGTVSTRQRKALALLKLDLTDEEGAS
ncbi:sigma-70 family RNA polymerase sigma factor [Pseudoflavonifractor phocaeensis]|uniref:sigma-70 family RNA polymerase sigma factor n=1 Tax=Pseudoflavonifractor phocaeensis TaxID=1870988 RepID=UPI001959F960|nr:sigma-70 family RNA polymerase sigma factor [Pseudoflavonifractor phocaeensis]MBM6721615.1 sigma-70 family RNA polymerase sigma factor [Pseudoflavonifractor phocaeensis]